jgi:hypothetical protein
VSEPSRVVTPALLAEIRDWVYSPFKSWSLSPHTRAKTARDYLRALLYETASVRRALVRAVPKADEAAYDPGVYGYVPTVQVVDALVQSRDAARESARLRLEVLEALRRDLERLAVEMWTAAPHGPGLGPYINRIRALAKGPLPEGVRNAQ